MANRSGWPAAMNGPWRSRPTRSGHKLRDQASVRTVHSVAEQGSSIIKPCLHTDLHFGRTVSSLGALRDRRASFFASWPEGEWRSYTGAAVGNPFGMRVLRLDLRRGGE